ncbi:BT_3044 domain-containing protein [Dysgonomonas gadei]|uniref:DUF4361 domain-containing protein n=1 Tax=Dysgonomonas gadei ATCC BAA-286 TaxID=742766 RepID=F5J2A6_9BACT|nr:DUF4361 domain-containing protein [Dysgonomonas gadei]EGK00226.1 hypothetical protein HMPREF9455_03365 [Dysgonomonas gadei ATCC BAA-286]
MRTTIKYIIISLLIVSVGSCDSDEKFEKELYEKYFYIVSDNDQIHNLLFDLNKQTDTCSVSIACSGTKYIDTDTRITLEKDHDILTKYNYSNFDINEDKYAKDMDGNSFTMPSMTAFLHKNDIDPYTTLPIIIKQEVLDKLSPDSIYFIPLKIRDVSHYQINEAKNNVLCRIYKYNKYANTQETTLYTMKGYQVLNNGNTASISGSKNVEPLNHNKVRMLVSNTKFVADLKTIARYAMTVEVQSDNTVRIEPYMPDLGTLEVQLLTPPNSTQDDFLYQNIYESKTKRFLLYYKYRTRDNNTAAWSEWITIKEATKRLSTES